MFRDVFKRAGESSAAAENSPAPKPGLSSESPAAAPPTLTKAKTVKDSGAYFSEDVEFQGKISFTTKTEIHGKFQGEIQAEGPLVIGPTAVIKANIQASAPVLIEGKVKGNVKSSEKVELRNNAHLLGDVNAPKFILQEGAVFVGNSTMSGSKSSDADLNSIFSQFDKKPESSAGSPAL
jgi:cytoskeletal protein CcmA (bactofilin family)